MTRLLALSLSLVLSGSAAAFAQPGDSRTLSVSPAPAVARALQFSFTFRPIDQLEGNAASQWLQACVIHGSNESRTQAVDAWLNAPEAGFDQDAAWAAVSGFVHDTYPLVLVAARKERCDWGTPIRSVGISTLLPELASLRDIGRMLALKARIEIVNHDYASAAETLTVGLRLGHDLGDSSTLIQGLVGVAVTTLMSDQLERWVQAADAPNLYWPLSNLYRPLVSLSRAYAFEATMLEFTFPGIARLDEETLSQHEAERLTRDVFGTPELAADGTAVPVALTPEARAHLIGRGMTEAEVDALPPAVAMLRWQVDNYRTQSDAVFKWSVLPYAEVEAALARALPEQAKALAAADGRQPMLAVFPAIENSFVSCALLDRRFAMLRTIEALRLHAAAHGAFPAALAEVLDVPVPIDPITGAPFDYTIEKGEAVISGRSPLLGRDRGRFERRVMLTPVKP